MARRFSPRRSRPAWVAAVLLATLAPTAARAGGGGQNMLIIVDPNDENAVRIANAYQRLRAIPEDHFLFVEAPRSNEFLQIRRQGEDEFKQSYVEPLFDHIASHGLTGQIDYVGTLGSHHELNANTGYWNSLIPSNPTPRPSTWFGLMQAKQLHEGTELGYLAMMRRQTLVPNSGLLIEPDAYAGPQDNHAIHHSITYTISDGTDVRNGELVAPDKTPLEYNYFMAGAIAYTGQYGNSADQVIGLLERTVAGDGAKPQGTIYFEENGDIRSNVREPQWPNVQQHLDERNIPWVEEFGSTPRNRDDVRGAVTGLPRVPLPNGSTYLPGSWADNLTSWGADFGIPPTAQTKATDFIAAGAGASSGTVQEPFAASTRFPQSMIHVYNADGATLGESFYRSLYEPSVQMFIGDLLAQPYADVPDVAIDAGPTDGQTVQGTIQLDASASLSDPTVATGIDRLELYIDGKLAQTMAGDSSSFQLDTTGLSDGVHEVRVVAVNNAAIESEGYTLRSIVVDNRGRSVSTSGPLVTQDQGVADIQVQTTAGDGEVERIELRHLGRVVGQLDADAGQIAVDATQLAYGANRLVPVAVYSDGQQVAGQAIELTREPHVLAGRTPTALGDRTSGVQVEYFLRSGDGTVAGTDYSGQPDVVQITDDVAKSVADNSRLGSIYNEHPDDVTFHPTEASDIDGLGIRFSGRFEVAADNAGEFLFTLFFTNDSARLLIDGEEVIAYANAPSGGSIYDDYSGSVFLGEGEHDLELLVANRDGGSSAGFMDAALFYRGGDGVTRLAGDGFLYRAIPEPGTLAVMVGALTASLAGGRRARRRHP